jgi:ABC-type polysaccharide/polyol phosphate transport system ATPase subunit
MLTTEIIQVNDLHFGFYTQNNGINTFKEMLHNIGSRRPFQKKKVLKGISFSVEKGNCFAIMGRNGCGKSTLLRIISGIIEADHGSVEVKGRISPLLALGVGLEPELSGFDNIRLSCLLTGIPTSALNKTILAVKDFSELSDSDLKMQIKRYSSGMMARLAFSIALAEEAEILIIDEILAVGDEGFQNKCYNRILELKNKGTTILFVSHAVSDIERICDKGILLEHGEIIYQGNAGELVNHYHQLFN